MSSSSTSVHTQNTRDRRNSCTSGKSLDLTFATSLDAQINNPFIAAGPKGGSQLAGTSTEPLRLSYVTYARACGASAAVTYVLSTLLWQAFRLRTDWWLSRWADGTGGALADDVIYLIKLWFLSFARRIIILVFHHSLAFSFFTVWQINEIQSRSRWLTREVLVLSAQDFLDFSDCKDCLKLSEL